MNPDITSGEVKVSKMRTVVPTIAILAVIVMAAFTAWCAGTSALKLVQAVPLPALHDGDFDHFAVDVQGKRLFAAAEENSKLLIFDLRNNTLIKTITDLKAPHSILYRSDLKKLFVVDGDLGSIKIYDSESYKPLGDIKLRVGADSCVYDPSTHYLYVVNGGKDAHMPNAYISVVDTNNAKQVADIKIDSDDVEAIQFETSGPRFFVDVRGNSTVEVFDRRNRALLATWRLPQQAQKPSAIAFDEPAHRLFVGTRDPGNLVTLNSDSGKVVSILPASPMVDDMAFDSKEKRIYFAATNFLEVFQERDPDQVDLIEKLPTAPRAKTGIFVPQLDRYYLGVPHHGNASAELRVYSLSTPAQ
jgi:DNA-binding beta-propeller fold protein YncE